MLGLTKRVYNDGGLDNSASTLYTDVIIPFSSSFNVL